jgi:hypothetical protein
MVDIFVTSWLSKVTNSTEEALVFFFCRALSNQCCQPSKLVQSDRNSCVGYTIAMLNTENCVFVPTADS